MIGREYHPGDSIGDWQLDPPPCEDHEPDLRCIECREPSEDSICDDCWFGEQVEADLEVLVGEWAETECGT